MGGFFYTFPLSYMSIGIGSLSLLGFPFLSGFFSKEEILRLFFNRTLNILGELNPNLIFYYFSFFFSYIAVVFTCAYSIRLIFYVFFHFYEGFKFYVFKNCIKNEFTSIFMGIPIFFLSLLGIGTGWIIQDMLVGIGTDFWKGEILSYANVPEFFFIQPYDFMFLQLSDLSVLVVQPNQLNAEFFFFSKGVPFFWVLYFTVSGIFIYSFFFSRFFLQKSIISFYWVNQFFVFGNRRWVFFDKLLLKLMCDFFLSISYYFYFFIDKGVVERIGAYGISSFIQKWGITYSIFTTGIVHHYLGFILLGFFFLIQLCFFF
jgi:NADH-ubiquinone oxidoreductase chain 5